MRVVLLVLTGAVGVLLAAWKIATLRVETFGCR